MKDKPRKDYLYLAGLLVIGLLFSMSLKLWRPHGEDLRGSPVSTQILESPSLLTFGSSDYDITVVSFTDYQCPPCKLSAKALDSAVSHDGRVRLIYKEWPVFGALSEQAARYAIAAAWQGKYRSVHQALMQETRRLDLGLVMQAVQNGGADVARAQRDLEIHADVIDAELLRARQQARALRLLGTPGYLIGGILVEGALDEAGFHRIFAAAREKD